MVRAARDRAWATGTRRRRAEPCGVASRGRRTAVRLRQAYLDAVARRRGDAAGLWRSGLNANRHRCARARRTADRCRPLPGGNPSRVGRTRRRADARVHPLRPRRRADCPRRCMRRAVAAAGRGTRVGAICAAALLAAGADVLFAPGYSAPLSAAFRSSSPIHDVSFAAHPEWFSCREGLRRRVVTRLAAWKAAKVITVSDFSKQEIVRHLGVPQSKVEVIYSGVTQMIPSAPSHAGRRWLGAVRRLALQQAPHS